MESHVFSQPIYLDGEMIYKYGGWETGFSTEVTEGKHTILIKKFIFQAKNGNRHPWGHDGNL